MASEEGTPLLQETSKKSKIFDIRSRILIYILLHGCAYEIRSVTETQYIYNYLKRHLTSNETLNRNSQSSNDTCFKNSTGSSDNLIQSEATEWTWYIQLMTYGIGLPVVIFTGPISDNLGSRTVMIYNVLVTILSFGAKSYIIYADLELFWYLVISGIEGLAGSHYTFFLCCSSMLSNSTKPDHMRSFVLALADAVLGIGSSASQIGIGYVIKSSGYFYPYIASTAILGLILLLLLFTLQVPSLSPNNTKTTPKMVCAICTSSDAIVRFSLKHLLIYYTIFLFRLFTISANASIRTLFILGPPFCWSSVHIGWFSAALAIGELVLGTLILRILLVFVKEAYITMMGLLSAISYCILYGISNSDLMVYIASASGFLRILPIPLIKGMLSRMVSSSKQGALFANIYVLEAVCSIGGSTVFNNIYHYTRSVYKGTVFFVMAGFPSMALVLLILVTACPPKEKEPMEIDVNPSIRSVQKKSVKLYL